MLTTDQVQMILVDLLGDAEPRVKGKEADAMRKQLKAEIKEIKDAGNVVDVPVEWEI